MRFFQPLRDLEDVEISSSKDERIVREDEWVKGINQGDEKAFEAMYRYYYPRLGQYLLRYVHSEKSAEDVIHNLFFNIWKNRTKLKPGGTLRAYLYTAAGNQALKYLRKEQYEKHTDLAKHPYLTGSQLFLEDSIEYKEFNTAVQEAVRLLPDRRRHIFLLHREDKLTYNEIAEVLDISIKTVETQISRSLKFLSKKLAPFRH